MRKIILFFILCITLLSCRHAVRPVNVGERIEISGDSLLRYVAGMGIATKKDAPAFLPMMWYYPTIHLTRDSLYSLLDRLRICAHVSESQWFSTPDGIKDFRYFCDSLHFKVYPLLKNNDALFLLESSINHGSGEYDNFVIGYVADSFAVLHSFKGYVDTTFAYDGAEYAVVCNFWIDNNTRITLQGVAQNDGIYDDSIISVLHIVDSTDTPGWQEAAYRTFRHGERWRE